MPSVAGRSGAVHGISAATPPTSLSPSRAGDFMQCPLLYRFRVIDKLPEKPSAAATRGTVVHAVLERLFDAPAGGAHARRGPGRWSRASGSGCWPSGRSWRSCSPRTRTGARLARWLAEAERLVERWFTLEDPTRLEPAERELFVEARAGVRAAAARHHRPGRHRADRRGADRRLQDGQGAAARVRRGRAVPDEVLRAGGVAAARRGARAAAAGLPRQRRRADATTRTRADLGGVERKLLALWEAIRAATETGDWRPRPAKLCGWCDHQAHCPEFGGTPPPYPLAGAPAASRASRGQQGRMGARPNGGVTWLSASCWSTTSHCCAPVSG